MNRTFFFFIFLFSSTYFSQTNKILVDEVFTDWEKINSLYTDATNDNISGDVDFGKIWIINDSEFLFIRIETGKELNLQNDNTLALFIDTDNNLTTGLAISGIGAELEYNFGVRDIKRGIVRFGNDEYFISHSDISLVSSPTVASSQFEIAIKLNSEVVNQPLFAGDTIKILLKDKGIGEDQIPNEEGGISYTLKEFIDIPLPSYSIEKLNSHHIRLLSYNVLFDSLFNPRKQENFSRIFQALKPDIIAFQEIYIHTSLETAEIVESFLPSGHGENWYHSNVIDLQFNTDLIILSRFPIKHSFIIEGHRSREDRANFAVLIDLRPKFESDLLVVNAHAPPGSQNTIRQQEIDNIMAFVRDSKNSGGALTLKPNTPIIIAGDLNLVGYARQQNTLITGDIFENSEYGEDFTPDWDGSNFADSKPFTSNLPMVFTWYDEKSGYSPGRLDYIVFSSSVLELKNSFVLFTPALNADSLIKYGLESEDVVLASDHLPVIADFRLSTITSLNNSNGKEIFDDYKLLQNYPNPFNPTTTIKYSITNSLKKTSKISLEVFDLFGRKISTLVDEYQKSGDYFVTFDGPNLSSGVYYYRLTKGDFIQTKKMLILK